MLLKHYLLAIHDNQTLVASVHLLTSEVVASTILSLSSGDVSDTSNHDLYRITCELMISYFFHASNTEVLLNLTINQNNSQLESDWNLEDTLL